MAVEAPAPQSFVENRPRLSYPKEFDHDLRDAGLSEKERKEILTTGWEYVRCAIPEYTNWEKYMAFVRLTIVTVVAEYRGELVDVSLIREPGHTILGYDIGRLLDVLFDGTEVHEDMSREYVSSLLFMTHKSSGRQSDLLTSWIEALAAAPATYFRLRDCDGQGRFFIAAAISCNDSTAWLTEEANRAVAEIAFSMYDSVAMYKHRAEGEVSNFYAYCGQDLPIRAEAYTTARDALWALETKWHSTVAGRCAVNLAKQMPMIHMSMRRYRYIEDGLVIGKPETEEVIAAARKNTKLWYRVDAPADSNPAARRTEEAVAGVSQLLYRGLAEELLRPEEQKCARCTRRAVYGARAAKQFGGVELCTECKDTYRAYIHTAWTRWSAALALSEG